MNIDVARNVSIEIVGFDQENVVDRRVGRRTRARRHARTAERRRGPSITGGRTRASDPEPRPPGRPGRPARTAICPTTPPGAPSRGSQAGLPTMRAPPSAPCSVRAAATSKRASDEVRRRLRVRRPAARADLPRAPSARADLAAHRPTPSRIGDRCRRGIRGWARDTAAAAMPQETAPAHHGRSCARGWRDHRPRRECHRLTTRARLAGRLVDEAPAPPGAMPPASPGAMRLLRPARCACVARRETPASPGAMRLLRPARCACFARRDAPASPGAMPLLREAPASPGAMRRPARCAARRGAPPGAMLRPARGAAQADARPLVVVALPRLRSARRGVAAAG
jgi:hypothetical protein